MAETPRAVTPVGLVAEHLARALDRLDGSDADPAALADVRRAHAIAAGLDPYLERCAGPEPTDLETLARRTRERDWAANPAADATVTLEQEMLSGHVEGRLLALLIHVVGARSALEIGMFSGYSALAMAQALPDGGEVVACELDPGVAEFARRCFADAKAGARIDVRVGPAATTLLDLAAHRRSFDLVFLDADKAGYGTYLDVVLDRGLLAPTGLMVVDNTLMQAEPWLDGEPSGPGAAIARFNEQVRLDPRVEQVLLPLRDGVTLVRQVNGAGTR